MNDRLDSLCVLGLWLLAVAGVVGGVVVEANGHQAPAWMSGVAFTAAGAIGGFLGRSRTAGVDRNSLPRTEVPKNGQAP